MKRLFWDLEVSPLIVTSWRVGRDINLRYDDIVKDRSIISVAWKFQGGKTNCLTWDKKQSDKKLLEEFIPILNSADESVAHYGDSFDLPWAKGRALKHGITTLPRYNTVDTCRLARKFYLPSNKLDFLAQYLGVGQKLRTGDGLWRRVVLENCQKSLAFMAKYNKTDVNILEKVWEKLMIVSPARTHAGAVEESGRWTCPRCGSDEVSTSKRRVTASGGVQWQMQCKKDGGYYQISDSQHKKYKKLD